VFEILRANVRDPARVLGDLDAQVAACHIGDRALQELARRHGASGSRR
jgi:N-methylhydantoinase B